MLVVTPYYNKPNEAGLRAHFAAASEAAGDTPVILYNIPSRSVINLSPELLAELAATHENIVAVKQANNDELGPIEGLAILAGNDDVFARTLAFGGAGRDPRRLQRRPREAAGALRRRAGRRRATAWTSSTPSCSPLYEVMSVAPPAVSAKTALELLGVIGARRAAADGPGVRRRSATRSARRSRRQGLLAASGAR